MRIQTEILIERYKDNLFAAAFNICRNAADAEDVVQESFIQYHTLGREFQSEEHIRAWLLRTAINRAKNINRAFRRRASVPLEDYAETLAFETPEAESLFDEVMKLPEKYRIALHLFYYEDYSVKEIAEILGVTQGNVKVRLSRGRTLLREALKEDWDDDE